MSRWYTAQQAERKHPAHTSIVSDQESAKSRFENNWGENISMLSDKDVLAVGGGTGLIHALDNPQSQVSVDPLYETKRITPTQTNAEIICGTGEYLPLQKNSFDIAISHNVLDHTQNPNNVLDEISRVLDHNGQFFFTVNTFAIPKIIRNKLGLIDTPHPHHFSIEEVEQKLRSSGFKIKKKNKISYNFTEESILTSLFRGNLKKAGGKLAKIKRFSAICHLN